MNQNPLQPQRAKVNARSPIELELPCGEVLRVPPMTAGQYRRCLEIEAACGEAPADKEALQVAVCRILLERAERATPHGCAKMNERERNAAVDALDMLAVNEVVLAVVAHSQGLSPEGFLELGRAQKKTRLAALAGAQTQPTD